TVAASINSESLDDAKDGPRRWQFGRRKMTNDDGAKNRAVRHTRAGGSGTLRAAHDDRLDRAKTMILLRSLLFVPGNKTSMLEKALALTPGPSAPDAYVPDMEDSVPAAEKTAARATIAGFVARLAGAGQPVIPRVNALDSRLFEEAVAAAGGRAI